MPKSCRVSNLNLAALEFTCKGFWLDVAEVVDALRIVPRVVLFAFGGLLGYTIVDTLHWYMGIPPADRTSQVTAVIGIIIPTLAGLATWVFKIYAAGGRSWGPRDERGENANERPNQLQPDSA